MSAQAVPWLLLVIAVELFVLIIQVASIWSEWGRSEWFKRNRP